MFTTNLIFQYIVYYTAWFVGLGIAAKGHGIYSTLFFFFFCTIQIIWQYKFMHRTHGMWIMIFIFTGVGFITDSIYQATGFIDFKSNNFVYLSPPWMIGIWANFALVFYSTGSVFFKRYRVTSILALISLPIAYLMGEAIGACELPYGNLSSIITGLIWAVLFPWCTFTFNRYIAKTKNSNPPNN